MAKLASLTGYTVGSASVTFGNIKRKIKLFGEGLTANGPATPKKGGGPGRSKSTTTPKSTDKRAASKPTGHDESETPTKRPKTAGKKKRTYDDDDDDDDEMSAPRVKKEEINDITTGAMNFYDQLGNAAAEYDAQQQDF